MRLAFTVLEIVTPVFLLAGIGFGWATAPAFDLDRIAFGVLVLQVATPVAVTSYLLAEQYGADAQVAAGWVAVSTLISVGALPLLQAALL